MQKVIKHIGDDERGHMAWGTFTCRRHRMGELMGLATKL